jgi:hypothetical protein
MRCHAHADDSRIDLLDLPAQRAVANDDDAVGSVSESNLHGFERTFAGNEPADHHGDSFIGSYAETPARLRP